MPYDFRWELFEPFVFLKALVPHIRASNAPLSNVGFLLGLPAGSSAALFFVTLHFGHFILEFTSLHADLTFPNAIREAPGIGIAAVGPRKCVPPYL